ncbi:hypothetical protein V6N12_007078 [Hibiscus sabdariffa]|uniref:Uncharacterized protein n=1 Tax=Hibiscus sabdariffa TaxID=183260 RepID=A0ABR2F0R8_9ROSI
MNILHVIRVLSESILSKMDLYPNLIFVYPYSTLTSCFPGSKSSILPVYGGGVLERRWLKMNIHHVLVFFREFFLLKMDFLVNFGWIFVHCWWIFLILSIFRLEFHYYLMDSMKMILMYDFSGHRVLGFCGDDDINLLATMFLVSVMFLSLTRVACVKMVSSGYLQKASRIDKWQWVVSGSLDMCQIFYCTCHSLGYDPTRLLWAWFDAMGLDPTRMLWVWPDAMRFDPTRLLWDRIRPGCYGFWGDDGNHTTEGVC